MLEFLKLATSAFLGMIAGLAVQWIKSGRDEFKATCDEFCNVIGGAADLASDYWLTDGKSDRLELTEARLMGFQARLVGLKVLAKRRFDATDIDEVEGTLAELFDSLTGGEFQVVGRKVDAVRCQQAQIDASAAMVAVRRAFNHSMAMTIFLKRGTARAKGITGLTAAQFQRIGKKAQRIWRERRSW